MHEMNLFLSASKNILFAKLIYFYLCQKIESDKFARDQKDQIFNEMKRKDGYLLNSSV